MFSAAVVNIGAKVVRIFYFYHYRNPAYLVIIIALTSAICLYELQYLTSYVFFARTAEITPSDLEHLAIAVDPDCVETANRVLAKFKKLCTGKDCAVAQVVKRAALLSCDIKLSKA